MTQIDQQMVDAIAKKIRSPFDKFWDWAFRSLLLAVVTGGFTWGLWVTDGLQKLKSIEILSETENKLSETELKASVLESTRSMLNILRAEIKEQSAENKENNQKIMEKLHMIEVYIAKQNKNHAN